MGAGFSVVSPELPPNAGYETMEFNPGGGDVSLMPPRYGQCRY